MKGSGISWYQNTCCSLGDSSTEPHEPLAPLCLTRSAHHSRSGEQRGPFIPQCRRESHVAQGGQLLIHLTSGFSSFPFWWCFVSVEFLHILRVIFRWQMWGLFYIHNGRDEGSCKSHLRLLPAAPWDQQRCWRVQGMLEEQEPVQKPQKWEAEADRDRVLGSFSAKRGAAGIKYISLSRG